MATQTGPEKQPLTYEQITRLCHAVAIDLAEQGETANVLMVLMQDISEHGSENAETIANMLLAQLFMWRPEHDQAQERYVEQQRLSVFTILKGGMA